MAQIPIYTQQNVVQGVEGFSTGRQATALDMGAGMGTGLSAFSSGLADAANTLNQIQQQEDVTGVHVKMATAQADLEDKFRELATTAKPGTRDFHTQIEQVTQEYVGNISEGVQTRAGQSLFRNMASNLSANFRNKAIAYQSVLDGEYAKTQYQQLLTASARSAYNGVADLTEVIKYGTDTIDNPEGIFSRVNEAVRSEFKRTYEADVKFAYAKGHIIRNPGAIVSALAPAEMEQFKAYEALLSDNKTPGGKVDITAGAMKWAPQVTTAAATKGVIPNILLAQIDIESGGDAATKDSPKGARGIAQFMPETAKQYGIDPADPAQAIKGQAGYMSDLLKAFGGSYKAALAAYNWGPGNVQKAMQATGSGWLATAPAETRNYVDAVLRKAGAVSVGASEQAKPEPVSRAPAALSLEVLNGLSWEQQNALVNEDVRLLHTKLAMQERLQLMSERDKKEKQEEVLNEYTKRIFSPKENGGPLTAEEIVNDPILTAAQKQHMVQVSMAEAVKKETGSNEGKVRELDLAIHAADNDPTKLYSDAPVWEAYKMGELNRSELNYLLARVNGLKDPTTNPFMRQVKTVEDHVWKAIQGNPVIQGMEMSTPGMSTTIAVRFSQNLQNKISEYRKANKNPAELLDPNSKDYVLKPGFLQAYIPGRQNMSTPQATVSIGEVRNGYKFKGGNPADKNNWEKI